MSERRTLKFANADAVAAEVGRLRKGYNRSGEWSLPQICKHLDVAMRFSMKPPKERKPPRKVGFLQWTQLRVILLTGRIPAGFPAPERIIPPDDTPESAIDEFLAALREWENFTGEFNPHPMLGQMSHREGVRLHLIHCAHHLGFLSPAGK